ncbi:hypothetical protein RCOM_0185820, partial [Ricinus communis]
ARDILKTDSMIILALIDNLEGPDSEEFSAAPSKLGDTLWLFANKNETEKVMPTFKEAADVFNGKLLFVYIKRDHKHIARQLSYAFHNIGNDPEVIAYSGHEASLKCIMNSELSLSNVKEYYQYLRTSNRTGQLN